MYGTGVASDDGAPRLHAGCVGPNLMDAIDAGDAKVRTLGACQSGGFFPLHRPKPGLARRALEDG